MASHSHIQWTQATWNPTLGCTKISPGCAGCYAIKDVHRMAGNPNPKMRAANAGLTRKLHNGKLDWTGEVNEVPDRLDTPIRTRKSTVYFVNSLSDLFHEGLSFDFIDAIFAAAIYSKAIGRDHTFQSLTKRAERQRAYMDSRSEDRELIYNAAFRHFGEDAANAVANSMNGVLGEGRNAHWPPRNFWLGASVEDVPRKTRIDALRTTVAAVRFLSIEPLLEDLGAVDLTGIHWCIVGGESGPGARPCNVEWVRAILRQCRVAVVPPFVKQLGANVETDGISAPGSHWPRSTGLVDTGRGIFRKHLINRKGGDWDEWPADLRVREMPEVA